MFWIPTFSSWVSFSTGRPYQILRAWRAKALTLILSVDILEEYYRVAHLLAEDHPLIDLQVILALLQQNAEFCIAHPLSEQVCDDADDDKFLACAIAGDVKVVISGDKHLLRVSGFRGVKVIKPKIFVDDYL